MTSNAAGRRTSGVLGSSLIGMLVLTGCTGAQGDTSEDGAAGSLFHELSVPEDSMPRAVQVGNVSVLAGKSETPVLAAGTRAEADERPRLAVWSADPGAKLVDEPTFLELDGAPEEVDLDGSSDLAALVGYSWDGAAYIPYAFISPDRSRWEQVTMPEELADARPTQAAVDGTTTYVVGTDGAHQVVGMRVVDGVADPLDLPEVQNDATVTALDASDGTVVITTAPSSGAHDGPEVVVSHDEGQTWEHTSLGEDATVGDAVVERSGEIVLLGSTYDDAEDDTWWIAAWSSTDGIRWQRDGDESHLVEGLPAEKDNRFGDAAVVGGHLVAPVTMESTTQMVLINRSVDGTWDGPIDRPELRSDGSSVDAGQLAPSALVSADTGGPAVTVVHGDGTAHFFDSDMRPLGTLGKVSPWFALRGSQDSRDGSPVQASRMVFTDDDDGWREGPESTWYVLEGDTLVAAPADGLPTDRPLSAASDPGTGTEVALFHGWDERRETYSIDAWSREPGGTWTKGSGFDDDYAAIARVVHAGDRWIAAGVRAASASTGDVRQAAAWTSRDGLRWKDAGQLAPGAHGSEVNDVCMLPTGGVLAVGSLDIGTRNTPVAWTFDGDRWARQNFEVTGDGSGSANHCVRSGDSVSVLVDADARTQMFTTTDGASFDTTWTTDAGNVLGETVTWGERFVAAGWVDDENHTGPVLYVSTDGTDWGWVPVPARSASGVELQRHGDGLVVSTSDAGGVQAWRVDDPEQLVRAVASGEPST